MGGHADLGVKRVDVHFVPRQHAAATIQVKPSVYSGWKN